MNRRRAPTQAAAQEGFTLVELLIWMVVATVLIISTIQLLGSNAAFTALSEQKLDALASAQELVDLITAVVNNTIESGNDVIGAVQEAFPERYIADPDNLFSLNVNGTYFTIVDSIQTVFGYGDVSGYKITVVSYYAQGKRHVSLEYFIEHQLRER